MRAAANFAFANRQVIAHCVPRGLSARRCGLSPADLGWRLVYDVCHNIAKDETHTVDGRRRAAHRAPQGRHARLPARASASCPRDYRSIGQPVLIPGDMGRYSFVLAGHRARDDGDLRQHLPRRRPPHEPHRRGEGRAGPATSARELRARGVSARATGRHALEEEMPEAYKDVQDVVGVVEGFGISKKVARLRPIGVVKG